ncbi:lysine biosynthesis protein LysW [Streptomyces sp. NPDC044780]|uniref:Lysine biosynthesis protein LysW n=1 Tax=Streptomyces luomodiensis TaxID=3026192 RepID=A0ABY9USW4_9ACTN|nr:MULTISPECIES: lysine biosynthesis protein LysW [unclassified Streptomyces]WAP55134.1 lysine biosynthesis protein LysW [Streptomyces sp. S465]WNE95642.1 lysine biosynthesis protein LysW [Streptomyces sp. SCA4-21]
MPVTVEKNTVCLVCDSELEIENGAETGEIIECGTCGQEHELTSGADNGYQVALAPEVEEDWGE